MDCERGENGSTEFGTLYIIATPIGNLGDITYRAIETLKLVDLVYCEDTRVSSKLLNHYGIKKKLVSNNKDNESSRASAALSELKAGSSIALISDAGTPLLNDPGGVLARLALENGIQAVFLPGPSAIIAAYVYSAFASSDFYFGGFLPKKPNDIKKAFAKADSLECPSIWFATASTIQSALEAVDSLYAHRIVCVCREMTKMYEQNLWGTAKEVLAQLTLKGEFVLVLSEMKLEKEALPAPEELQEEIKELMATTEMDAIKKLAKKYGVGKSSVYSLLKKNE
ncbi:MAG: 16S rRNA (cytidine(1402)-2'-O)-methyltransferase [Eubacteriaceae bacterium]|nr:16S rRNA (cytidine(1402)-2'-O)-methyltransferase [Eubacteriaceae bacterium]